MSAFGRRPGMGTGPGARPAFGVARPMQGGGVARPTDLDGGEQFPPLNDVPLPGRAASRRADRWPRTRRTDGQLPGSAMDAMARLAERQTRSGECRHQPGRGFRSSIHRIKEQVLPRLLERVDPEAAATLDKDELAEEFRPIIGEVLAELKLTLNRREQFALEKVLVDELLGLGPLEELLADPNVTDIMVNGPDQTFVERKGKLELAQIQFRDEEHLFQIAQRICNSVGRRVDQTTPLADARLKDGSRVNVIVPPLSLRGTAISIRKFSAKPITLDMMAGFGSDEPEDGDRAEDRGRVAVQRRHLGRHRLGQDDDAQRAVEDDRPGRARADDRGRGRTSPAAAALAAARNPSRQPGGSGRNQHPRPRQERAAYAPRPHHPRRNPWSASVSTCSRR